MKQSDISYTVTGADKHSPITNQGEYRITTVISRIKLPHGWVVVAGRLGGTGACFVPFAEDGTGWGKNDPVQISIEEDDPKTTLKFDF
jgi:hypothetical protein